MADKSTLLEAIAGSNRGLLASDVDHQAILTAIAELEAQNPTPSPINAVDMLNGNWRLLYTTSDDLLRLDQIPLLKLGQVYQCIRARDAKLYNIAEIVGIPFSAGIFSVAASFKPVSEKRVDVNFERTIIGFQGLMNYRSPDEFIHRLESGEKFTAIDVAINNRDRQGWLDITYLDSNLRIGRGNVGSIFVLTKV
ncbi:MAG: PAP/fibrillin family protein [Elainellaceae cyanobacterium]